MSKLNSFFHKGLINICDIDLGQIIDVTMFCRFPEKKIEEVLVDLSALWINLSSSREKQLNIQYYSQNDDIILILKDASRIFLGNIHPMSKTGGSNYYDENNYPVLAHRVNFYTSPNWQNFYSSLSKAISTNLNYDTHDIFILLIVSTKCCKLYFHCWLTVGNRNK